MSEKITTNGVSNEQDEFCRQDDHIAGVIVCSLVRISNWEAELAKFEDKVNDFNIRGQREQVNHPGWMQRALFCPNCGSDLRTISIREELNIIPNSRYGRTETK